MCCWETPEQYKTARENIYKLARDLYEVINIWIWADPGLRRLLEPIIYARCPQAYDIICLWLEKDAKSGS